MVLDGPAPIPAPRTVTLYDCRDPRVNNQPPAAEFVPVNWQALRDLAAQVQTCAAAAQVALDRLRAVEAHTGRRLLH